MRKNRWINQSLQLTTYTCTLISEFNVTCSLKRMLGETASLLLMPPEQKEPVPSEQNKQKQSSHSIFRYFLCILWRQQPAAIQTDTVTIHPAMKSYYFTWPLRLSINVYLNEHPALWIRRRAHGKERRTRTRVCCFTMKGLHAEYCF